MILAKCLNYSKYCCSFLLGLGIGALIFLLVWTGSVFLVRSRYVNKVYPGIFLNDIPLSGKSRSEVEKLLAEKTGELKQKRIVFLWQDDDERRWEVSPEMIDFKFNQEQLLSKLMAEGRSGHKLKDIFNIYRLLVFPKNFDFDYQFNQKKLENLYSQIALEFDRPVHEALFEFKGGKVLTFQESREGRQVKKEEMIALIPLAFSQNQKQFLALELPVEILFPKITTSESNRLGIKESLAEGESFFYDSIPTRIYNIALASSYLHGTVISPGEIFSFSEKVGTISAETGYKQAYVIKEKKTILEDGGGVCQVSTTLFRAALNAGLPIIERHPHYYRVSYYEQGGYPPGLDAAVYPPSPDLKFRNDTPSYILIQTEMDQERKRLVFKLFGTSDGRKIEVDKPIIHFQTPAPDPVYVDDPTLPAGVIKRVDQAHPGAKVSVKRKVLSAGGQIKEEKEFWSDYTPWPASYQRGTGQ